MIRSPSPVQPVPGRSRPDSLSLPHSPVATRSGILSARTQLKVLALLLVLSALVSCAQIGNPQGGSGGTISGDALYIATRDGELLALDRATGSKLWGFALAGEDRTRAIYGAPAVDGETVYIGGYDGILYALSTDVKEGGDPKERDSVFVGDAIIGSPVVADGVVLVGSSDFNLYAFDILEEVSDLSLLKRDGFPFATKNMVWSTPVVVDGVVYFGSLDHGVYAVNLDDGSQKWRFPADGGVVASPIVDNGRVYVGSLDQTFYAINAETGDAVWRFDGASNWYWGQAIVTDDTVYAPSLDGKLYALDKDTGRLDWALETDGSIVGTPVIVGDFIAVPSLDGILRLVNLKDRNDRFVCNVEEEIRSSLVAQDGSIYFRAKDRSVRALNVARRGNPDEDWMYSTREDPGNEVISWACTGPKRSVN